MTKEQKHIRVIDQSGGEARISVKLVLAMAGVAAASLYGLSQMDNTPEPHGAWEELKPDTTITGIVLEDNARLRTAPRAIDSSADGTTNRLATIDKAIEVSLQDIGARRFVEDTDTWYGIDRDAITQAAPGLADDLAEDEDGVVWVSTQKSDTTKSE